MNKHHSYFSRAVKLARIGMQNDLGGPFGCVIVKDGTVVGEGQNRVTSSNDPTAHAEIVAIRNACNSLNSFQLTGCDLYTTCEPCPMCLGAIYWARPRKVYFAGGREDAAGAGFDDRLIYEELEIPPGDRSIPMQQIRHGDVEQLFKQWVSKEDKTRY